MTTIHLVVDNGDIDYGFMAYLGSAAFDVLGANTVKVVPHATETSRVHEALVAEVWDRWSTLSAAERESWRDR